MEPVGLAQNLSPERVMRAQLGEEDLAIWRSASGRLSAWGNRCPHRGMRLSYGFVRGESLACAYHGWHYNCKGSCHFIPAHPELEPPDTIKPRIFPVAEQSGVLWVSTEGDTNPVTLPDDCAGVRSIAMDCDMDSAVRAFFTVALQNESLAGLDVAEWHRKPRILSLAAEDSDETVFILIQRRAPDSVVCHILADNSWSAQGHVSISRWSESVRREAERNNDSN